MAEDLDYIPMPAAVVVRDTSQAMPTRSGGAGTRRRMVRVLAFLQPGRHRRDRRR